MVLISLQIGKQLTSTTGSCTSSSGPSTGPQSGSSGQTAATGSSSQRYHRNQPGPSSALGDKGARAFFFIIIIEYWTVHTLITFVKKLEPMPRF